MSNIFYNIEPKVINTELACLIGLNEAIILQQFHYWIEKNKATATNFRDEHFWTYGTLQKYTDRDFPFWSQDTVRRTISKLIDLGFVIKGNYNKMKMDKTSWYAIDYVALNKWINEQSPRKAPTPTIMPIPTTQADASQSPTLQNINMDKDICQMQHGNMPSSSIADSHVRALQNATLEHGKISTSSMADCNAPSAQTATLEDDILPSAIQETIPEIKKEINHKRLDNKTNTQRTAAPTACESVSNQNATPATHQAKPETTPTPQPTTAYDAVILDSVELLFDEFWKLYPRKESRAAAQKAWKKLKPDQALFNLIANALEYRSQTKEWLAEGGRYIPHPATWLNGRRWEDELDEKKFDQSAILQERYSNIQIDGKPLDPVQRKQLEYIEKQMRAKANADTTENGEGW